MTGDMHWFMHTFGFFPLCTYSAGWLRILHRSIQWGLSQESVLRTALLRSHVTRNWIHRCLYWGCYQKSQFRLSKIPIWIPLCAWKPRDFIVTTLSVSSHYFLPINLQNFEHYCINDILWEEHQKWKQVSKNAHDEKENRKRHICTSQICICPLCYS